MVDGKFGVSAKVLCDSISEAGVRLLTFEVTYPRIILSEINTHRALSRNSASSRAVPFHKMKENLIGRPTRFGQANQGMQDKGEDFKGVVLSRGGRELTAEEAWYEAKEDASFWSEAFFKAGYAKQIYNRTTEAYQQMKSVISATEWTNWYWLRDDAAADPTIASLARCMREAQDVSEPQFLKAGEYHLPYVESSRDAAGKQYFWWYLTPTEKLPLTLEDAIKVSCARSAAVSFRNTDYGLEKCKEVYERLVGDERKHASALEHQATPILPYTYIVNPDHTIHINNYQKFTTWQDGVSHADRSGQLWSGNFRGWVQFRKTIAGENKAG